MEKNRLDFLIITLNFLDFLCLMFTGLMMYLIPRGYGGLAVLGLTRNEWGDIHLIFALTFVSLIIIHVVLHWSWEKKCFKRFLRIGPKTLIIIAALLIALSLIVPMILTRDLPERGRGRGYSGEIWDSYGGDGGSISYFKDGNQNGDFSGAAG